MERRTKWLIALPLAAALALLCVCMGVVGVTSLRRLSQADGLVRSFQLRTTPATSEETQTFPIDRPARLVIDNPCGSVTVRGADRSDIIVTIQRQAWGANEQDAQAQLETLELELAQEGDTLQISLPDPEKACRNLAGLGEPPRINLDITTPVQTAARITTDAGSIDLEALGLEARLETQFGAISVHDLGAGLEARTQNGKIEAVRVQAGDQAIQLSSQFGSIHLEQARGGKLEIASDNGGIELSKVDIIEASKLNSAFGNLGWQGGSSPSVELQSQNGKITLSGLQAAESLRAQSDFGDITLEQVASQAVHLTTLNGRIEVDGAAGQLQAQTDFGDIQILNAEAVDFNLTSKNGKIVFQGSLGAGPHQAKTDFGSIQVQIPAGTGFDYDLQTEFGKISVGEPGQPGVELQPQTPVDKKHWQGSANGGGALVQAVTQNGNISIELAPPAP